MEPVAAMHAKLVEVDTLVVGDVGTVDTVEVSCCVWALGLARWDSWFLNKIHHIHLVL